MFATHPEMAKRWAAETPNIKNLPEKKRGGGGGGGKRKLKYTPGRR
jgi:hypothetical protein